MADQRPVEGTTVTIVMRYSNRNGVAETPERVDLTVEPPGPATAIIRAYPDDASMVAKGAGWIETDLDTSAKPGRWQWRAVASGDADFPLEGWFDIRPSDLRSR